MGDEDILVHFSLRDRQGRLVCIECGAISGHGAHGWRVGGIDEPELDEQPAFVFYCPSCWQREFGE